MGTRIARYLPAQLIGIGVAAIAVAIACSYLSHWKDRPVDPAAMSEKAISERLRPIVADVVPGAQHRPNP
jgi:hypothetical protein